MKILQKLGSKPVMAGILVVTIAACGVYPGTSRSPLASPLPTPTKPPTPLGFVEPTRTPTPTKDVNFDPDKVTPEPTWTPTITPVVVNRAGALPEIFTYRFVVERADGRREVYYVPVGLVPMVRTESDRAIYEAYVQSQFNLGPGDVFVGGCALSPWMIFLVSPQMVCTDLMRPPSQPPEALTQTPTP